MTDLRSALQTFLEERSTDRTDLEVTEPRRLGGGSSQENWAFDALWTEDGARRSAPLLLRRRPESGVVDTTLETEFALLGALAGTDVPVAGVHWTDDGTTFGRPSMIVERRPGAAHRGLLRDSDPLGLGDGARLALARGLADLLSSVHRLDPHELGLTTILPDPGADPARAELDRWVAELDRVEPEPQPALRFTARWLRDHLPEPPRRVALVHGDFRPANVLVHDGRLEVLLDWELARLGDPVDDLGWYTCSIYRREHFLPGRWEPEGFLDRYALAAGLGKVDRDRLHFWQVMATFRLAVIALTGVGNFLAGSTDRPAAPADRVARQALTDTGMTGKELRA
ncbi:phosphotransferase family protein [Georgenia ruanii]|uniref:Phosphotransferase n=1 Tax=Georgenia ruanii TaxID=348442 RepID=A0A7J9V113_9MICO|nr:phosphotransferase family protein [Georgenia ruanii]MPV90568.1 phosphotransferase [Georgenia ruanii]